MEGRKLAMIPYYFIPNVLDMALLSEVTPPNSCIKVSEKYIWLSIYIAKFINSQQLRVNVHFIDKWCHEVDFSALKSIILCNLLNRHLYFSIFCNDNNC